MLYFFILIQVSLFFFAKDARLQILFGFVNLIFVLFFLEARKNKKKKKNENIQIHYNPESLNNDTHELSTDEQKNQQDDVQWIKIVEGESIHPEDIDITKIKMEVCTTPEGKGIVLTAVDISEIKSEMHTEVLEGDCIRLDDVDISDIKFEEIRVQIPKGKTIHLEDIDVEKLKAEPLPDEYLSKNKVENNGQKHINANALNSKMKYRNLKRLSIGISAKNKTIKCNSIKSTGRETKKTVVIKSSDESQKSESRKKQNTGNDIFATETSTPLNKVDLKTLNMGLCGTSRPSKMPTEHSTQHGSFYGKSFVVEKLRAKHTAKPIALKNQILKPKASTVPEGKENYTNIKISFKRELI